MPTIITRLFDTYEHAQSAVQDLEGQGVAHSEISLIANNEDSWYGDPGTLSTAPSNTADVPSETAAGAGTGATLGTVIGGGAGLLAGLGMLAIPGVGPVVAAGWLVATAAGAGLGAAGGGLLGSLVGAGVSETDAHVYAEGVRRGGTLVTVRANDPQVAVVERVLDSHHAVDTVERGDAYRAEGWSRFDETAPDERAGGAPGIGPSSTTLL